jgi:hypothetical protein
MKSIPWLKGKFHIPEALWRKHQYLDLYPLDGGASFIVDEFVGTRDDQAVARKLIEGDLLKKWGALGDLDWKRHGETRNLELYCWLHRWYFVPSLARTYFLERDEARAELVFSILADWAKKMGSPGTKEEVVALEEEALAFDYKFQRGLLPSKDVRTPWEWYDFQPAYRLIVLLVCTQLLQESQALQKHSTELHGWIGAHANSILWVTQHYGYKYGNHHTLRMMALYLAGTLVEHPNAEQWRTLALEMQTKHISEDFFADGMYKESLPGYTPFVITHFREVLLSAIVNGHPVPAVFETTLRKALRLLKTMVMPDGYLPVINDGPRVDIRGTLDLMEHHCPSGAERARAFMANEASGFPIFHDERNYLIFDANYAHGTHVQAGKLGFILWRDREPFIIEGGCCNYDHPDFQPYFRRGWAHSTLLVDGEEDAVWKSFWVWAERAHPVISEHADDPPFVRAESDGFKRLGVKWSRRIDHPDADSFTITDRIANEAKQLRAFTFRFILAQEDVRTEPEKCQVQIRSGTNPLTLRASLASEIQVTRVRSNFFGDMRQVPCVDFIVKSAGDFTQTFALAFSSAGR